MTITSLVNSNGLKKTIDNVNLSLKTSRSKSFVTSGTIKLFDSIANFSSNIDLAQFPYKSDFQLETDSFAIKSSGLINLDEESKVFKFQGDYEANIVQDSIITRIIFQTFPHINSFKSRNLKTPVKLSGITSIGESGISSDNFTIMAKENLGIGTFLLNIDQNPSFNLKLDFKEINLDELLTEETNATPDSANSNNNYASFINLNASNQLDVNIYVNIPKIVYADKKIENILIDFAVKDNFFQLNKLQANLPDNLLFDISNSSNETVDQENVFVSEISVSGEKLSEYSKWLGLEDRILLNTDLDRFTFKAKLVLAPSEITLLNIDTKVGNGSVKGRWTTKNLFNGSFYYDADLLLDNFQFSSIDFPKISSAANLLLFNTNDPGYLAEYRIFRNFDSISRIKFDIENSKIQDLNLNKLTGVLSSSVGKFSINQVYADTDILNVKSLDLAVDARALRPSINFSAYGDKLDYTLIKKIFNNKYNSDKESDIETSVSSEKWSSKPSRFFRFDKLDGAMELDLKHIIAENFNIDNLVCNLEIKDEVLFVNRLNSTLFGGDIDTKGNINFENDAPNVSLSFSFANFEISNFLNFISSKNSASGKFSLSGSVYSKGESPAKLIYNLVLDSTFAGRNLLIKGVDMKTIVDIVSKRIFVEPEQIESQVKNAFLDGASPVSSIDGSMHARNGKIYLENTSFNSYFSSGVVAANIDLMNLLLNTLVNWTILPTENSTPITTEFDIDGSIDDLRAIIKKDSLLQYIKNYLIPQDPSLKQQESKPENIIKKNPNSEFIYQDLKNEQKK